MEALWTGSIEPKYPEDITLDSVEKTCSDGSKNLQLISSGTSTLTTTLGVDMNLMGRRLVH